MSQGSSKIKVIVLDTVRQTQRRKVLELLMLSGMNQKEIAEELSMSQVSVKKHSKKLYETFGVNDRIQLLARYDLK